MDKRTGARAMIEKYNKITPGFVTQVFQKNEKFICVEQHFTAGDPVDRENEKGEPVDIDIREEQYQPFDMVQPCRDKKRVPCPAPMNLFYSYMDEVPNDVRVSTTEDCEKCEKKDCDVKHCLITDEEQ